MAWYFISSRYCGVSFSCWGKTEKGSFSESEKRIGRYKWDCFFFFSLLVLILLVVVLAEVVVVRVFNNGVNPSPHWHQSWAKTKAALYTAFVYLQHWTEQKWHKYCPTVGFMQTSHCYTITDYLCVMLPNVSSCSYKAVLSKKIMEENNLLSLLLGRWSCS